LIGMAAARRNKRASLTQPQLARSLGVGVLEHVYHAGRHELLRRDPVDRCGGPAACHHGFHVDDSSVAGDMAAVVRIFLAPHGFAIDLGRRPAGEENPRAIAIVVARHNLFIRSILHRETCPTRLPTAANDYDSYRGDGSYRVGNYSGDDSQVES